MQCGHTVYRPFQLLNDMDFDNVENTNSDATVQMADFTDKAEGLSFLSDWPVGTDTSSPIPDGSRTAVFCTFEAIEPSWGVYYEVEYTGGSGVAKNLRFMDIHGTQLFEQDG